MKTARHLSGFTLTELMVTVAVLSILVALAAPDFGVWIKNNRIRTAGEVVFNGMQLARSEAIKRNQKVNFQLLNNQERVWRVTAQESNFEELHTADRSEARIFIKGSAGTPPNNSIVVTPSTGTVITFDGFGRVAGNPAASGASITDLLFDVPDGVMDENSSREMKIQVGEGGQLRFCDPAAGDGHPAKCL